MLFLYNQHHLALSEKEVFMPQYHWESLESNYHVDTDTTGEFTVWNVTEGKSTWKTLYLESIAAMENCAV